MICLTGDIHHHMGTPDQRKLEKSEIKAGVEYSEIAKEHNIKANLFLTGKSIRNKEADELLKLNNIEIGGHTWSAFRPRWIHYPLKLLWKKILKKSYAPSLIQERDIKKTINIIEEKTGKKPVSWRTHAYRSDEITWKLLEKNGIKIFSDELNPNRIKPYKIKNSKLISLPLNVMPDHEHLYHGNRTPQHVRKEIKRGRKYKFTQESYHIDKYFEIIKKQIKEIKEKGGVATVLLHPACMKVADNFKQFKEFCEWIEENDYKTIKCKELVK